TIVDDDPPTVTITPTDDVAREAGASSGVFTVSRVGSLAANLVVDYSVSGTAVMGDDYAALPGSITIPAGRTSALITVTPVDDALVEGDETITISLTSSPAYNVSDPATA